MTDIMKNELTQSQQDIITNIVLNGDISALSNIQRVEYYNLLCKQFELNPAFKPFDILVLNGKTVLYPNKNCAEQLRDKRQVSIIREDKEYNDKLNIYTVTVYGKDKFGKEDIASASITLSKCDKSTGYKITKMNEIEISNQMMKCETKAKRRLTFSICGLGMYDEDQMEFVNTDSDNKIEESKKPEMLNLANMELKQDYKGLILEQARKVFKKMKQGEIEYFTGIKNIDSYTKEMYDADLLKIDEVSKRESKDDLTQKEFDEANAAFDGKEEVK
jgi:hypothetical protein